MNPPGKFRALLATLRIANAPSVVSNVFLGYVVGWFYWYGDWNPGDTQLIDWESLGVLFLAGLLIYFSGNLANDWFDRKWDAEKRPERALPSGLYRPGSYLICSFLSALAGILLAFREKAECGICAAIIVALVWIYTLSHKKTIWSVVPMGLCRAGLYFLGFCIWWPALRNPSPEGLLSLRGAVGLISIMSIGLFSYIAGLSLSARYEGMGNAPRGPRVISLALLILPLLAMSCTWVSLNPFLGALGMIPFAIWLALCRTKFRKPIPRYVSALLAGIPLVDFIAAAPLALIAQFDRQHGATGFPLFWVVILVPLVAFVTGRLFQKVASAT